MTSLAGSMIGASPCDSSFVEFFSGDRIAWRRLRRFAVHGLVVAPRGNRSAAAAMPPRAPIVLVVGGALGAAVFVDQRLPIGDRNLIIVRMNFAEGEKAVAIAAIIDERGLQ